MMADADNSLLKMSRCGNGIFWTRRNEWGEYPMKKIHSPHRMLTLVGHALSFTFSPGRTRKSFELIFILWFDAARSLRALIFYPF
jgi:hypothetical protein